MNQVQILLLEFINITDLDLELLVLAVQGL